MKRRREANCMRKKHKKYHLVGDSLIFCVNTKKKSHLDFLILLSKREQVGATI